MKQNQKIDLLIIMRTKQIFIYIFATFAIGTALLYWNKNKKAEIPTLLDRKGGLSLSSEWKNTKRAIETLRYKVVKNRKDYTSKLMLAYAFMQEARVTGEHPYYYPAALEMIEDVLSNTTKNEAIYAKALVAKASVELSLHHFADALETGKAAIDLDPYNKDLYGVLCDANVELGRYQEAVKMADKMVALRPELQSYSRVSYLREIHGDIPGAIEAMKMAVESGYPGFEQTSWTRYNLAKLYERSGDTMLARKNLEQVLLEDKNYAFAIGGMAGLKAKAGDYKTAEALYLKALNIIPEFSFQEELAKIYVATKNPKAQEAIDKTIVMLKEDSDAGHDTDLEMANLHLELTKDYDKALEYAEKEYERRPENIDVNRCLAIVYKAKGKNEECKLHLAKANRTHKKDPELMRLCKQS